MGSRFVYDSPAPGHAPFKAAVAIAIGDLLYIDAGDSNTVKPAGSFTWDTDLATTQESFIDSFVGVAAQRYDGSNATAYGIKDGLIRFNRTGVYEFDCASATFAYGALVGPAKQTGNLLEPQKVVAVATYDLAIGRVIKPATSATKVLVEIMPWVKSYLGYNG